MEGKSIMVIMLGTHFMFNEELGSRLRGIGYMVYSFDNIDNLLSILETNDNKIELVIFDLQHNSLGGLDSLAMIVDRGVPTLALCEHKETETIHRAKNLGVTKLIVNSQAVKDIEGHVNSILKVTS